MKQQKLNQALVRACKDSNVAEMKRLVLIGADPNVRLDEAITVFEQVENWCLWDQGFVSDKFWEEESDLLKIMSKRV